MLSRWQDAGLRELLAEHGLTGIAEEELATDGWSGSRFSRLRRPDGAVLILKRTSATVDWIVRTTHDDGLREAWASTVLGPVMPDPGELRFPYLGAAADGDGAAILMPDLSAELIAWDRPDGEASVDVATLDRVLGALARLHATAWPAAVEAAGGPAPWCPLPERLTLTARPTQLANLATGGAGARAAERLLEGWDAFERHAPRAARDLVASLAADPSPLVAALARLPAVGLHGDLKLANVALHADGGVSIVDWQMILVAPVAVELGWFVVSNSSALPVPFDAVAERYRVAARRLGRPGAPDGDWAAELDLARIVGLLLRGWRKGLDAEAGTSLASGVGGAEDLAEWAAAAVEAAGRRL